VENSTKKNGLSRKWYSKRTDWIEKGTQKERIWCKRVLKKKGQKRVLKKTDWAEKSTQKEPIERKGY